MKLFLPVVFCLPLFLFGQSQRQTYYPASPACYVQSFTPLAGGGSLLSGFAKYGTDSCLISLVFLNDSDEIVSHREFNTATDFDFASHVVPVPNGFLIGGKSSDPSFFHPQLIKTDLNGNVMWAKYFDNTSYWQGQIIRIIPNGSNYSMYTFAETPFNDFYRIETDAAGSSFSGWQYMPDTGMSFRVFDAEQMFNSSSHILCGHGNFNSASTRGGLLMKVSTGGVQWAKHITAGGDFKNDIVDVTTSSDGHSYSLFVCENIPGNQYSTIVLKFDSLGNKVWAKQLALGTLTLNGSSIIESDAHDFYVASYDNLLVAYLSKLDASGNLVWTHKWSPSQTGGASALKLFKDDGGNIVFTGMLDSSYFVSRLDANGNGCNFVNSTAISVSNVTPVITNITFTTSAFVPATVNETNVYSSFSLTENILCGGVGISEMDEAQTLTVYPNPVRGELKIRNEELKIQTAIEISVYDLLGEKLTTAWPTAKSQKQGASLDVSSLSPGVYFLQLSDGEKIYRGKFVKE